MTIYRPEEPDKEPDQESQAGFHGEPSAWQIEDKEETEEWEGDKEDGEDRSTYEG